MGRNVRGGRGTAGDRSQRDGVPATSRAGPGVSGVRVVQLLATSGGGVGRHVAAVAAGLVADGAATVLAGPSAVLDAFGPSAGGARPVPVELGDRPRPEQDLRALLAVRRLAGTADVVHAHGVRAGAVAVLAARSLPRATAARRGAAPGEPAGPGSRQGRRARPAVVVTLHNARPAGGAAGAVHGVLERVVARGADAVLVVSQDLGNRMRGLRARRVARALVPAPPPRRRRGVPQVRGELGVPAGTALLVTVARLAPQKGLPVLLDALARLGRSGAAAGGVRVVIAGDGPLRDELATDIRARDLPVVLLGARDDAADLIAAADLVVLPSRWEGQPLVAQEALHLGAALLATDAGGTAEVCGDAAVLVPGGDPEALARALARLLSDPAARADLARRARRRAADLPTDTDLRAQLRTLYTELRPGPRD